MPTTIKAGATTIVPTAVRGYSAARAGGTLVHPIIGKSAPDITLRAGGMRTGTLRLTFTSETAARTAWTALSAAVVCTLTSTDLTIAMSFVVPEGRDVTLSLDEQTQRFWTLDLPFQEVTP